MNPLETTIDTSKQKLEIMSSGVSSQHYNSSALNRNSLNQPSLHTDRAMIKYVIGTTSANEQQESILKKSATNQIITSAAAPATIKRSNSIAKSVNWTEATATSVKFRQTIISAQNEVKQQVASAKLPTIKNLHGLSEKAAIIQRPLNIRRPPKQLIRPHGMQTATTTHGHTVYKTNNGYLPYPEMIASSLMAGAPELIGRKLPTIKDVSRPNMSRLEKNPINVSGSRLNPVASTTEVTQITSTVTLTKAPITANKQNKSLQSPLVTIEKKGNNQTSNLLNSSKAGKITFPNSAEAMDIVVNTIGGNKIISLGSDSDEPVIVLDSPQKSLLKQSPPPTSTEKTPLKPQLPKAKQQSLLKVNSMVRLLQTSPRTKRSKSLTAINAGMATKRRHHPAKGRRISTYSESEITLQKTKNLLAAATAGVKEKTITAPIKRTEPSLFCNERIETIPISSSSNSSRNSSLEICEKKETTPVKKTTTPYQFNIVLEMLSSFNMLNWKDRIGSGKDGKIKYQLNDFNLLQVAEVCPTRNNIYTAYEKPIAERESFEASSDHSVPLYLCTRCECHGPASDFLAPGFCSLECYRREYRKRSKTNISCLERIVKNRFFKKPKCSDSVDDSIELSAGTKQVQFAWPSYLHSTKSEAAPIDLFLNPFPCEANLFEVGMKLEAIDPEHNSLFCVCTVVEKKGYRLQLKFDGYSKMHNFWVNADSMDIFPPGWCAKTNRVLQPPKGMNLLTFNWPTYLTRTKSQPAPRNLFTHLNSSSTTNPFKIGMRLEADDLKNTGKVCVATVSDVLDNRILIHFDGWDERYDYWIDINSPYIHPINWHEEESLELVPPPDWDESFSWPEYLEFTRTKPAQPRIFSRRFPIEFYTGMKLEVVDLKSPSLIRPATVLCRSEYKILLHLDGWPSKLSFWVNDDSTDIHPIGWCEETGHDLEPPPGYSRASLTMPCPVKGCCGLGNAKRIDIAFHATEDYCPYVAWNWETELEKPSRLDEPGRFGEVKEVSTIPRKSATEKTFTETITTTNQAVENIDIKPQLPIIEMKEFKPTPTITTEPTKTQLFQPSAADIKIAREFLCDYGPRLKQNYMIWHGNSNFNPDIIKKNPLKWTTKETAEYITAECHPIGYILLREDIDGLALLSMQQSDLTDILKIKLGPAMKIFSHILHLRNFVVSRLSVDTKPLTDN